MRSILIGLMAALVVASAAKAQDSPSERTFELTTSQDREVRIHTYTPQRPDCMVNGLPAINVTTPPAHGRSACARAASSSATRLVAAGLIAAVSRSRGAVSGIHQHRVMSELISSTGT